MFNVCRNDSSVLYLKYSTLDACSLIRLHTQENHHVFILHFWNWIVQFNNCFHFPTSRENCSFLFLLFFFFVLFCFFLFCFLFFWKVKCKNFDTHFKTYSPTIILSTETRAREGDEVRRRLNRDETVLGSNRTLTRAACVVALNLAPERSGKRGRPRTTWWRTVERERI